MIKRRELRIDYFLNWRTDRLNDNLFEIDSRLLLIFCFYWTIYSGESGFFTGIVYCAGSATSMEAWSERDSEVSLNFEDESAIFFWGILFLSCLFGTLTSFRCYNLEIFLLAAFNFYFLPWVLMSAIPVRWSDITDDLFLLY